MDIWQIDRNEDGRIVVAEDEAPMIGRWDVDIRYQICPRRDDSDVGEEEEEMDIWLVDRDEGGRIVLVAPNGERLFAVSDDTAEMIGRMLIDEAEASCRLVDDPDVDEEEVQGV